MEKKKKWRNKRTSEDWKGHYWLFILRKRFWRELASLWRGFRNPRRENQFRGWNNTSLAEIGFDSGTTCPSREVGGFHTGFLIVIIAWGLKNLHWSASRVSCLGVRSRKDVWWVISMEAWSCAACLFWGAYPWDHWYHCCVWLEEIPRRHAIYLSKRVKPSSMQRELTSSADIRG